MVAGKNKRDSKVAHAPRGEKASAKPAKGDGRDVGRVLRTVYDRALAESIPQEMLDLLGKLD